MVKKKLILTALAIACVLTLGIGATVAFIATVAGPVENTFTIGDIELTLEETTGEKYQLIPGASISKNPKVTVGSGSEDCWLFVKITKEGNPDSYLEYSVAEGWMPLLGHKDVYYRTVSEIAEDKVFGILANDIITVKESLTKEQMKGIEEKPTLTFTAYAVQSHGIDSAAAAYNAILAEE